MSAEIVLRDTEMKLILKLIKESFSLVELEELDTMRALQKKMKKGLDRPSRRIA